MSSTRFRLALLSAVAMSATLLLRLGAPGAEVPRLINFQGRLLTSAGTPEVGIQNVGFALYDAETGGTPLWSETQTIAFSEGFYSVLLGSVSALPISVLTGDLWIGVTVGGTELLPRMPVVSVAFALRAEVAETLVSSATGTGSGLDADSVDGLHGSDLATAGHTHAPGDADTLDGIDASGFADVIHAHGTDDIFGPMVSISSTLYTGTGFRAALAADETGVSICGAGSHVCIGWEMRVHSITNANMSSLGSTRAWVTSHHSWSDTGNWDHSYGNDGNGGCLAGAQMVFQFAGLSHYQNHTWCDLDTLMRAAWCCENL